MTTNNKKDQFSIDSIIDEITKNRIINDESKDDFEFIDKITNNADEDDAYGDGDEASSVKNDKQFRNKFEFETQSEYEKAKKISVTKDVMNDFYLKHKLDSKIKKSSIFKFYFKIILIFFLCALYYIDISVDSVISFYKQSYWFYATSSFILIILPIILFLLGLIMNEKISLIKIFKFSLFLVFGHIIITIKFFISSIKLNRLKNNIIKDIDIENTKKEYEDNFKKCRKILHTLKTLYISELIVETIPQLFLQMFILINSGLKKEKLDISILRMIFNFIGLILASVGSTFYIQYLYNHYVRYLLPDRLKPLVNKSCNNDNNDVEYKQSPVEKLNYNFIILRFITNMIHIICILFSVLVFLLLPFSYYSKWFGFLLFLLILLIKFIAVNFLKFNAINDFTKYGNSNRILKFTILNIVEFFNISSFSIGISHLNSLYRKRRQNKIEMYFLYIWYSIVWLFVIIQSLIFYFYLDIDYFKIRIDYWYFQSELKLIDLTDYATNSNFKLIVFVFITLSYEIALIIEVIIIRPLFHKYSYQYFFILYEKLF